jgi:hypothetical protein
VSKGKQLAPLERLHDLAHIRFQSVVASKLDLPLALTCTELEGHNADHVEADVARRLCRHRGMHHCEEETQGLLDWVDVLDCRSGNEGVSSP